MWRRRDADDADRGFADPAFRQAERLKRLRLHGDFRAETAITPDRAWDLPVRSGLSWGGGAVA